MKKHVELFGNIVKNQVEKNPTLARKLLEAAYSFVRFTSTHKLVNNPKNVYGYLTGEVAGTISDSFRKPENSVMVNIFFPCEILHAMNITPMLPEGISCYLANTNCIDVFTQTAEDNDIPETFCSYHKAMIGAAETNVMPAPLMIANTTLCCDANQLSFRRLANYYGVEHFVIDVPRDKTQDSIDYVSDQLREFSNVLQDVSHRKLDENKLKEVMVRSARSVDMYRNYVDRRGKISIDSSMTGEMVNLISNKMMLGTKETEKYYALLQDLADISPKREASNKKRIFWVHTLPNWQSSLTSIFEDLGNVEIVGTDIATDCLEPVNPDKPYESMARRIINSSFNGMAKDRINSILESAKKMHADGIIVFCHWGCKQTLGMSQLAKQVLEKEGFPTLVLDGDGCDYRNVADGQMVTRVNAFIEQLEE